MKKHFTLRHLLASAFIFLFAVSGNIRAQTSNYFNGFETSVGPDNWDEVTRVTSGTNGITSANGAWHAEVPTDADGGFTRFGHVGGGSYNAIFPPCGFTTSLKVYLDLSGPWANDTRFHYTSAINNNLGNHRRDFAFNAGFYNDLVAPGSGARFVISTGNNTGRLNSFPKNTGAVVIITSGWYTFEHNFRNNAGVLAVDLTIYNASNTPIATWTLSDPTDLIGLIGGSRYGWVLENEFSLLAIDNSALTLNGNGNLVTNTNTGKTFCTIQAAIDDILTLDGHTIVVSAGTYDEDVTVNKSLIITGAGAGTTTIRGPIGGGGSTVAIADVNVEISGFTITRAGNNTTDWNNAGLNTAGISAQGLTITGTKIHDNIITGMRTGIDINNSNGHTINNNVITNNRTGLIFRNQTDNIVFQENEVTNNWTVGILFLDASGGTNIPVQTAANCSFFNNNISGNWYGQVVDRQTGGSLPAPGGNLKNFSGNWYGTNTPVVTTANSTEPGYAVQIPVAYGGTATPPGGQPDIAGPASANIDYTPYLNVGTDTDIETTPPGRGTFGFQGDFSNLWVTAASAQTGATTRIQEGVNLVSGSIVNVTAGIYNENVVISTSLTLQGAGNTTILTPSTPCSGNGITINANNTIVKKLRVTNYTYGVVVAASVVLLDSMESVANCTGGIEMGNGISGLTVKHSLINSNAVMGFRAGTGAQMSNITIDSCEVKGNVQGTFIAAAASGNSFNNISIKNSDFSNNTQKGMYFEKLSNAVIENIIMNNSGTDPAYNTNAGIDINLKFGNYSNITIQNCSLTNCGAFGTAPSAEAPVAITIKARDDASSYNSNPATLNNVFVLNNVINGPQNGLRFGEFAKINNTPTNVQVHENDLSGPYAYKAIINNTPSTTNATCNWFGTTNAVMIAAAIQGPVIFTPYLVNGTDNSADPGFQPVPNSCTGCPGGGTVTNTNTGISYCTIMAAIADPLTLNGHTITVGAGTYPEDLIVSKSLTIKGPNFGVKPCLASRVAEAILKPANSDYLAGVLITITADDVTIDGFTLDGDNTSLTSNTVSMGADIDVDYGVYSNADNTKVNNNIIKNIFDWGIFLDGTGGSFSGEAKYNKIQNIPDWAGIAAYENYYAAIEENCMTNVWEGVLVESYYKAKPTGTPATVVNNTVITSTTSFVSTADGSVTYPDVRGIRVNLHYSAASPWTVSNNVFTNTIPGTLLSRGIQVLSMQSATSLTLSGNNVTGFDIGYDLWNNPTSNSITVSGGNVSNCNNGVFPNNYDGYGPSDAASSAYVIDGVTISGSVINGIFVKDNPLNSNGATVAAEIKNCTISGGAAGILVSGADASANIHDNANTISGTVIGVDVDGGSASLFRNNINTNGTGVRVTKGGLLTSTTENFIKNCTSDGIRVDATAGAVGLINNNDLSGNSGFAINNNSIPTLSANCNWYGSASSATVVAEINGPVNYVPWLTNGSDNSGTNGFQPVPASCNGTFTGPTCSITGPDGPVCPSSSGYYSAPAGMSNYSWSISGNGSISGSTSLQTVTVIAGTNCNASFTLTVTITDNHELSSTCTKTVLVKDLTKPTITLAPASSVPCNPTATQIAAAFGGATVTDNCTTGIVATGTIGSESGSGCTYYKTKTWSATDACGNKQTATQTVSYKKDTQKPVITLKPATSLGCNPTSTQIAAAFGTATVTDNCSSGLVPTSTISSETGSGCTWSKTKTWTATDACGNKQTATQTVTYKKDTQKPVISNCPSNISSCNSTVSWTKPTATDNCGLQSFTGNHSPGETFPSGTTTVTYTATDACGNTSTCSFTVTVNSKTPSITCPYGSPFTKNAGANCKYTISSGEFKASAACACGVVSLSYTLSGATTGSGTSLTGVQLNKGTTTITWKAVNGSYSSTCSITVNVKDVQAPSITCKPGATKQVSSSSTGYTVSGTEFNATASDYCGTPSLIYCLSGATTAGYSSTNTSLAGKVLKVGTTTITWKATDGSGNVSTCSTVVKVSKTNYITKLIINGSNPSNDKSLEQVPVSLTVRTIPNPSTTNFTLQINSSAKDKVNIRITDIAGRVIEMKSGIVPNSTVKVGGSYFPGSYIAEVIQGKEKVAVQLIKIRQ